ncbi:hypothetical protein ABIA35_009156 [Catenulispora sp. MAP12-49]|uniref:carbohydrate-binding protein n=1 Tax=Catenulispora sp. MAP12-49 TaxID=3156302 RepID=UPI0035194483
MRVSIRSPRSRGALLAACVVAVVGAATVVPGPAYARPSDTAGTARTAPVSATAPLSGNKVAGAVYGTTAVQRAGTAASGFRSTHQDIVASAQHADANVGTGADTGAAAPQASQLHDWWGTFPNTNSGPGGMATQSVDPNLRLSNSADVLYAPTMTPANNSCIEVVTVHTTTTPQVWAWDWCNSIAPGAEVDVDSSFLSNYTTTVNGRIAYTQKNVQTNKSTNTWTAYLYNVRTGAWDTLFTSSGTDQSGLSYGWDMFEFYSSTNPSTGNTYVCGDLAKAKETIESSNVQVDTASGWAPSGPGNSTWQPSASPNPSSYKCPKMVFHIVTNNSDWTVYDS